MLRKEPEGIARAQRFRIELPVRYRMLPNLNWFMASTANISRSGLLFRTKCAVKPGATLDLTLELPRLDRQSQIQGEVVCKGEVVRVEPASIRTSPAVAVALHNDQFARRGDPLGVIGGQGAMCNLGRRG
jgi:hypothetical protein